jgi:hypothetical protein
MLPGPFAFAERWDETGQKYLGLLIDKTATPHIVIDRDSVIVKPDVAEAHRPAPKSETTESSSPTDGQGAAATGDGGNAQSGEAPGTEGKERLPTRFIGTVMISPDRPARDIHQIVEAIVEQLTTMPNSEVTLKLEIDAEVPGGLDRAKVRTIIENATTLGFIDKSVS